MKNVKYIIVVNSQFAIIKYQEEINDMMIKVSTGRKNRLQNKGRDGLCIRKGEEALRLENRKIEFEVIQG